MVRAGLVLLFTIAASVVGGLVLSVVGLLVIGGLAGPTSASSSADAPISTVGTVTVEPPSEPTVATADTDTANATASAPPVPTTQKPPTDVEPSTAPARPTATPTPTPRVAELAEVDKGTALYVLLNNVRIGSPRDEDTYDRDVFEWRGYDFDRNGCDTRNDVLRRDLDDVVTRYGTNGCVVQLGTLQPDPYSGTDLPYERGNNQVEIDHMVSLWDAWRSGASGWDAQQLREFGNDPLNLLAVSATANGSKSNKTADQWVPPHKDYRCEFIARQISVKAEYDLSVTRAEFDAMVAHLESPHCEGTGPFVAVQIPLMPERQEAAPQPEPAPVDPVAPQPQPQPAPVQPVAPQPVTPVQPPPVATYYKNCTAVWAAIGRPIYATDPGYASHLDGDGDGTGCENRP